MLRNVPRRALEDAMQRLVPIVGHAIRAERSAGGWVIALADMPRIGPATIRRIVDALNAGASIAAPRFQGTRGHPVGFAARLGDELAALTGDSGARAVLDRHRDAIVLIDCDDAGVLYDIDRKDDAAG